MTEKLQRDRGTKKLTEEQVVEMKTNRRMLKMMNKDLIDFTKKILSRYNATPDEWDAFEDVKWSIDTTHKISAVFYPQKNEVEATWENIATGKEACATFPVTPDQGEDIAEVIMPCVYHESACEPPDSKLWDRISELEACIRQMCNTALDLGYCDMRDCHDCKTFKVCGVAEAESPWATWSKVDVADEIRRRMAHFYLQTDGTMKFPNSAEGDLLKMVHVLLSPNTEVSGGTPSAEFDCWRIL